MCGIVAILHVDSQHPIDEGLLRQMTDTMVHRGPDDAGYWTRGPVGLGHRRLSIIDLSPAGHQPMSNEDGTIWITYNGEVYNFKELRHELEMKGHRFRSSTDTETIVHAYEEWGTECLSRFNGIWAFALWDGPGRRLFVSRDRFGVKPLVYYQDEKRFICASEIKGILADRTIPREMDPESFHHYLSLMNVPAPFTIYKDIRKLKPGHFLLLENGQLKERTYWDLSMGPEIKDEREKVLRRLEEQLSEAVRIQMVADVPLGLFLSGGLDSSLISAFAAKETEGKQLNTFNVSFQGLEDFDESSWASEVGRQINSNHHEFDLSFDFLNILPQWVRLFDEPFAISSALALYRMSMEVGKHVKVVLTGDGADEVFGGYPWRHSLLHQYLDWFNRWPITVLRRDHYGEPVPPIRWRTTLRRVRQKQLLDALWYDDRTVRPWMYFQSLYCYNEAEKDVLYTQEWAAHQSGISTDAMLRPYIPQKGAHNLSRWLYFDIKTTLADEMLAKVDKATMACGVEARVPFLDHRLVEYAINLPSSLKASGREGKLILKELGRKYLPAEILRRRKHGFNVPLKVWFRGELQTFVKDILSDSSMREAGYFRPEAVREILRCHFEERSRDFSNLIFVLLCFELWRRESNHHYENPNESSSLAIQAAH